MINVPLTGLFKSLTSFPRPWLQNPHHQSINQSTWISNFSSCTPIFTSPPSPNQPAPLTPSTTSQARALHSRVQAYYPPPRSTSPYTKTQPRRNNQTSITQHTSTQSDTTHPTSPRAFPPQNVHPSMKPYDHLPSFLPACPHTTTQQHNNTNPSIHHTLHKQQAGRQEGARKSYFPLIEMAFRSQSGSMVRVDDDDG